MCIRFCVIQCNILGAVGAGAFCQFLIPAGGAFVFYRYILHSQRVYELKPSHLIRKTVVDGREVMERREIADDGLL